MGDVWGPGRVRSCRLVSVIAAVAALAAADQAAAADPTCDLVAGQGNTLTFVCNSTDEDIDRANAALKPGTSVSGLTPEEPSVSCTSTPPDPSTPTLIQCDANPPAAPGTTIHVHFTTGSLYTQNPDDNYFGCSSPCNDISLNFGPTDFNGPDRTTPPPPPSPSADLFASVSVIRSAPMDLWYVPTGVNRTPPYPTVLPVEIAARNAGPDQADDVVVSPEGDFRIGSGFQCAEGHSTGPTCPYVDPGLAFAIRGYYPIFKPGVFVVRAAVSASTPDPDLANNETALEVDVGVIPDSGGLRLTPRVGTVIARAQSAAARLGVTGRAKGARDVYVAIARRRGGARVMSSAAGCSWLRSTRGAVRRENGRRCDSPIWLKARGRTTWRLALRKPLPPGAYTVLARAVSERGVTEVAFTRKDGNRIDTKVPRGR